MDIQVNQRIAYGEDTGTIRYIGEIPNWPNEQAIGIEWDDFKRGKNNGILNGVCYFKTLKNGNTGSFIKFSSFQKKYDLGRSIIDALVYKYGDNDYNLLSRINQHNENDENDDVGLKDEEFPVIQMGIKRFESFGFTKLSKLQSNFSNLKIVSLDHLKVNNNSMENNQFEIDKILEKVYDLSLNFNLFDDFTELLNILVKLPELQKLSLIGNKFINTKISNEIIKLDKLIRLDLSSCYLSYFPVIPMTIIPQSFENLKELNLSDNKLQKWTLLSKITKLKNLQRLNLSFNKLVEIDFQLLNEFESLSDINLSNNEINIEGSIDNELHKIKTLDLSYNKLNKWEEIDSLSKIFVNLTSFKGIENPLFINDSREKEELDLIQLISRLNLNLKYLNGTEILAKQRINFELYFINKVKSNEIKMANTTRWLNLCESHNVSCDCIPKNPHPELLDTKIIIDIKIKDNNFNFKQLILPDFTVGKLKGKISRRLNNLSVLKITLRTHTEYLLNDQALLSKWNLTTGDSISAEIS